jgi:hypothetical protein
LPWSTNHGIVAHSTIAGAAAHQAERGSADTATRASAIATSAIGKFTSVALRLSPPANPARET